MSRPAHLNVTVAAVRSASALTETTFLHLGQTLEASILVLSGLTSSFETVMAELNGENLSRSITALADAATRVAQLGRGQSEMSASFDQLQRVAEVIAGRISKLNKSVGAIDSLVINSKIAATAIQTSEIDFTTFAGEIGRTMAMTRTTLDSFGAELQTLRQRVGSAHAGQLVLEQRHDEATRSIPAWLNATVASIPLQHRRAAQALTAVRRRSERVRAQVGTAIMALQVGDITRQRLEHADYALGFLTAAGQPSPGTPGPAMSGQPMLSDYEERGFTATTCRLQAAQIADAAAEFEREVRQITAALNSLAADARALRSLAVSAYSSAGHDQGSFIAKLEAQVGEALALFADFGTARAESANVMASVSDAAEILCGHLTTVQSLEADIRIMGLNTTLKCARVGPQGRALGLIAQELRSYGNEFAKEAGALMGEVEGLARVTRSIGSREADAAPLIAAVMEAMRDALSILRQVGEILDVTLSGLDRDSDRVVTLLEQTTANLGAQDEIRKAMRVAANTLRDMSPPGDPAALAALTPRAEEMLGLMVRGYTMATERIVHDRVLGRSSGAPATPAGGECELEDMLL